MGISVSIIIEKWESYDKGETWTVEREKVFSRGTTHNLCRIAKEAYIYQYLWRHDENDINKPSDLIPHLLAGLVLLRERPEHYKQFNSPNGWGAYEVFVEFISELLNACKQYPDGILEISR